MRRFYCVRFSTCFFYNLFGKTIKTKKHKFLKIDVLPGEEKKNMIFKVPKDPNMEPKWNPNRPRTVKKGSQITPEAKKKQKGDALSEEI